MKTNIYFFVEQKVNGEWKQRVRFYNAKKTKSWFEADNMDNSSLLPGYLAGAGNNNIKPLSQPNGLPSDLSPSIKLDSQNNKGYAHSYYLLSELLSAKEKMATITGILSIKQYRKLLNKTYPKFMDSEGFNDDNALKEVGYDLTSSKDINKILKLSAFDDGKLYFSRVSFDYPVKNICEDFWGETLSRISRLDSNPENIRCVFWFDYALTKTVI